ncbi:PLP-dependent aminotransferase family protein [Bradyrhizobium brasilense]|uniref:aminotransferase-like domain-containing protein n=1 Tax=Bradyrhizobium brasilense TaxID=1419277 RepID=UPI0024B25CFC|nr:PLP-dependent aminotransferase family protein [Bradyrhizobium australafricanum]WFU33687.1 PLP-dependent aminotransferase family protein [Bradyrhizobium australafricanum]
MNNAFAAAPAVKAPLQTQFDERLKKPIALRLNPPPPVAHVFDPVLSTATSNILEKGALSEIIGHHRWCGTEPDRRAGAEFCASRLGYRPDEARIVLTSSTQSTLNMLIPGLVGAGGTLAVDELTYPPIKGFAARYGVRLAPVRMDDDGMIPDAFRTVCQTHRPKAFYPLATLQNPTTVTMSVERRKEVVAIAREFGVSIIEDDIYSLIPRNAPPPLSALAPELSWYLLGLAKSVAPGMKVAYVVAPSTEAAAALFWPGVRATFWMTAPLSAALATELIETGSIGTILDAVRSATVARHTLVRQHLTKINHRLGDGGLHVWVPAPPDVTSTDLATRLEQAGVLVSTSDGFVIGEAKPPRAIRFGLGNPSDDSILERALTIVAAEYNKYRLTDA